MAQSSWVEEGKDFSAVYQAHFPYVWKALRRLGVPEKDREDVAHDVFLVVHRRLPDFDATRPIRPWLFGIVYRVALDRSRRAFVQREQLDDGVDAPDPGADVVEQLEAAERRHLVERGLSALDVEKRAVFVLHELDELAAPEIARILEVPLNTVYSRLRAAREGFEKTVRRLVARERRPGERA